MVAPALPAETSGSIGGGAFVSLLGGDLLGVPYVYIDTSLDDSFAGGVLNPALWGSAVVGSGTVTQNDGLFLRTGAAATSSAAVTSVASFGSVVDLRIGFSIQTDVLRHTPADAVRFFDAELQASVTNYFRVSRLFDLSVTGGHAWRITCVVGSVTVENLTIPHRATAGVLRMYRIGGRVIIQVGSETIYDHAPFVDSTAAPLVLRVVNPSATESYDCTTVVSSFEVATAVLFDSEPAVIVRAETSQVQVHSPVVETPRSASISVYTAAGLVVELLDAFAYTLGDTFVAMSDGGVTIGILDDPALRNLQTGRPGHLL